MERLSGPEAESFAGKMKDIVKKHNGTHQDYVDAYNEISIEENFNFILIKALAMPEIREIIESTPDQALASEKIIAILVKRFPKIENVFKSSPELVSEIAYDAIELVSAEMTSPKSPEDLMTQRFKNKEKAFEGEFSFEQIASQICKVDDWAPSELKKVKIIQDLHGEVISWQIGPINETEALVRLEQYVLYIFDYPMKDFETGGTLPTIPTITKMLYDSEFEELDGQYKKGEITKEQYFDRKKEFSTKRIIFEFEDGKWQPRFGSGGEVWK